MMNFSNSGGRLVEYLPKLALLILSGLPSFVFSLLWKLERSSFLVIDGVTSKNLTAIFPTESVNIAVIEFTQSATVKT